MKINQISYTPNFKKKWSRLPAQISKKAAKKEVLFRQDIYTSGLLTHKLSGKFKDYWSFSIDYHWRIIFRFLKSDQVLFVDVDTHEIYR